MKVSLNWLQKFASVELTIDELVAKIGTQLGAVEEIINLRDKYKGLKVVQITEAKPHPDADKLNIYQMTDGREQIQVVAGDKNLNIGDKVAWIPPGATVPSTYGTAQPLILEARKLRGETSNGMFGSGKELDINDDHLGVLKLDTDAAPGTLFAQAYELDDVIIDIENKMFTHRPDCFGLLGVAREVAGIQHQAFHSPEWYLQEAGAMLQAQAEPLPLSIANEIPMLCPTYLAATMRGVTVKPSPVLTQTYLKRVGIRPINNVVDTTNYLMYLTGQPLHAFDYDKVARIDNANRAQVVVRTPKKGETLTLLDGRTITPHKDAILICTKNKPIAMGGVMGGAETEVDQNTKNIIIESANFDMYSIRRTSMEHGIFTDAVTRFSKGQSQQQCGVVLAKAVEMIGQHADAMLASELGIEKPVSSQPVTVTTSFINQRLGAQLQPSHIKRLLENVEMHIATHDQHMRITPPFWRTDIEIPEDLVEEVGRLHGYNQLPHELPLRPADAVGVQSIETLKTDIRNILAAAGNNELQTYSFVSVNLFSKTGQDPKAAYRLRNALSPELQLVRTSLLPSLLDKVHRNHKAGYGAFGLFEVGKSHNKHELGDDALPRERLGVSYVFSAERKAATDWGGAAYYQAKQQLNHVLEDLKLSSVTYVPLAGATLDAWWLQNLAAVFEPKRAAIVSLGDRPAGVVGEFSHNVRHNFKLPDFIAGFEIDLGLLHGRTRLVSLYQPLLRFPAIEQDVCLRVKQEITYAQLEDLIKKIFIADQRLRVRITPIDIYQQADDQAYKQITYRLTLQHHDRTFTTKEANLLIGKAITQAHKTLGAEQV